MRISLILFLCLLVSCELPSIFNGKKRGSSSTPDTNGDDGGNTDTPETVEAPNSLTLSFPSSSPSLHRSPKIVVAGIASGDAVKLYNDSLCSNLIGSGTSSGTSITILSDTLSVGNTNFYAKTTTASGIVSKCSSATLNYTVNNCPTDKGVYIHIPGNADYEDADFCVAKYEMKDVAGTATSQVALTPSVSINKADAISECTELGTGYNLISNTQWQTIARNIELVPSNWENGVIGQDKLNTGHSDNNPTSICDASVVNVTTNCSTLDTDFKQKRTHTLSNLEVIWDFSGNVNEWVKDDNSAGVQYHTGSINIYALTSTSPTATGSLDDGVNRAAKGQFGPTGDYSTTLNSIPYGGLGGIDNPHLASGTNNSIYRGSSRGSGAQASGIFAAGITASSSAFNTLGFRCVFSD